MKKLLSLLALCAILTGCGGDSGSSAKKSTCTGAIPGASDDVTIVFNSEDGEKINKMDISMGMKYADLGLTKEVAETAKDALQQQFSGVDGMEATVETEEDQYMITLKFDYSKVKEEDLDAIEQNLGAFAQIGGEKFDAAVKSMEDDAGFTCK